jgi:hypothetical protein
LDRTARILRLICLRTRSSPAGDYLTQGPFLSLRSHPAPSRSGRSGLLAQRCSGHYLSERLQLQVSRRFLRPSHCHRCQRRCGYFCRPSVQSSFHNSASKPKEANALQTGFYYELSSTSDSRSSHGSVIARKAGCCPCGIGALTILYGRYTQSHCSVMPLK